MEIWRIITVTSPKLEFRLLLANSGWDFFAKDTIYYNTNTSLLTTTEYKNSHYNSIRELLHFVKMRYKVIKFDRISNHLHMIKKQ